MNIHVDPLNLIICGVGGQGNVLIASLIANALYSKDYYVTVGDTFGAAQRGGAVFSSVRISNKKPYGPLIPEGKAHLILGLEPMETLRQLQKYGNQKTVCMTNTHTVYPLGVIANNLEYPEYNDLRETIEHLSKLVWFVDATELALNLGAQITTNIIMAGALVGSRQLPLTRRDVENQMRDTFTAEKLELNIRAFEIGFNALNH